MQALKAGVLYFALVFGAGFVLRTIRTLWVAPRVGTRKAELMEMPFMLVMTVVAARWLVMRIDISSTSGRAFGRRGNNRLPRGDLSAAISPKPTTNRSRSGAMAERALHGFGKRQEVRHLFELNPIGVVRSPLPLMAPQSSTSNQC